MDWVVAFSFGTIFLMILIFIGLPVGLSLMTVGIIGVSVWLGPKQALNLLSFQALYQTPINFLLLAIPLFVLLANFIDQFEVTGRLYQAFADLFAGIRGVLATATIGMGAVLGACMGASTASVATLGQLGIGEMLRRGYKKWLAAGSISGAGGLAIVIPPSIPAIVFAFTMELPVLDVFAACVIPGFLMALGYVFITLGYPIIDPGCAPTMSSTKVSISDRMKGFLNILPFAALVIFILSSIFLGYASITEAAATGCLGAFILVLTMGTQKDRLRRLFVSGKEAAVTTCYIMLLLIGATIFGQFWTFTGVVDNLAVQIRNLPLSPTAIIITMNILVLFFGTFMDQITIIIVVLPILICGMIPLGYSPIHLGVIYLINIEMALTTPPLGMNLFVLSGVAQQHGVTFFDIVKGSIPFLVVDALVILSVIFFPELALWIPSLLH